MSYARWSSVRQAEGSTEERRLEHAREYASRHGLKPDERSPKGSLRRAHLLPVREAFSQRGGSVTDAWPPGVRGAHLPPLAPPYLQRHTTVGSASPGFAPPRAPPAPCVVLPLEVSRSHRDAHGYSRSGPCGTSCTRMHGCRTDQPR